MFWSKNNPKEETFFLVFFRGEYWCAKKGAVHASSFQKNPLGKVVDIPGIEGSRSSIVVEVVIPEGSADFGSSGQTGSVYAKNPIETIEGFADAVLPSV